jgi:hypothetical protein
VLEHSVQGPVASQDAPPSPAASWGPGGLAGLLNSVLAGLGSLYVGTGSVVITIVGSVAVIVLVRVLLFSRPAQQPITRSMVRHHLISRPLLAKHGTVPWLENDHVGWIW